MTKGILYICYDGGVEVKVPYFKEVKRSISSLRKYCKLPITIYTNGNVKNEDFNQGLEDVNVLIRNEIKSSLPSEPRLDPQRRGWTFPKLHCFKNLPYDMTIFVDTDTVFFDDPSGLISEDYDLAICRDVYYKKRRKAGQLTKHFNTGFFIARRGEPFKKLIDMALDLVGKEEFSKESRYTSENHDNRDQPLFNLALDFIHDINIRILPQKWNVRGHISSFIDEPKMIHDRRLISFGGLS